MRKNLILALLVLGGASAQTTSGDWTFRSRIDKMTDKNTSYAYTKGIENSDAILLAACQEDGLNVYFIPDEYLGSEGHDMYWRFDKNAQFGPFKYDSGTEGDTAFIPTSLVSRFIANAKVSRTVILRVMDYEDTPHTITFSLLGFKESFARLNCN